MEGNLGFVDKVKGFILNPIETFQKVREEGLGEGLRYFVIWIIIYGILYGIMYTIIFTSIGAIFGSFEDMPGWGAMFGWATGAVLTVIMIVMIIVFGIIGLFIGGAWLHLWVRLMGGKKGYHQTVKSMVYGDTPTFLLGWIPFINFITGLWSLILLIFGIKELQEISTGKAALAVILAIIIPVGVTIILAATIYVWVSGFGA